MFFWLKPALKPKQRYYFSEKWLSKMLTDLIFAPIKLYDDVNL